MNANCASYPKVSLGLGFKNPTREDSYLKSATPPFNPQLKGVYDTPGNANSIKVIGSLVFVTDEGNGLQILNVSDPTTPTLVGSYDTAGTARGIDIVGNYAYIGDGTALRVLDISNTAAPNLVATYNTTGTAIARGVDVQGLLAYVTESGTVSTDKKVEILDVSAFDNIVTLTSAKDTINAQSGDDILSGDFSTIQQGDILNGGSLGIDTLTISGGVAANAVTITAASTTNQLAIANPVLIAANVPVVNGFERFDFSGFLGNVSYTGTTGYDWVQTGAGADSLNGGVGADTLIGGNGNDTYVVDNLGDFVVENAGGGTDTIQSFITYSLVGLPNVENLTLTGSTAINGTGNSGNNVLTGNSGNNVLSGGAGKDTLTGGTGTDRFVFTRLADSRLAGYDVISDYTIGEQIDAPSTVAAVVLNTSSGIAASLAAAAISSALGGLSFLGNTAKAFTVTGQSGTFLAFNDATAGFNAATDSIVQLSAYSISATNTVTIV
jgi:Ca2+-binding RTX toxin-like protein